MCGLCGILGDDGHWADGLVRPGDPPTAAAVPRLRREARRQRLALGNKVLRPYGLSIADWQGASYVLTSRTGATEIVSGLSDLWSKAERLAGRPIDPLDPALIEALRGGR